MSGESAPDHAQAAQGADGQTDPDDRHRLTTLSGLAALSLDALSSVAYGPEVDLPPAFQALDLVGSIIDLTTPAAGAADHCV